MARWQKIPDTIDLLPSEEKILRLTRTRACLHGIIVSRRREADAKATQLAARLPAPRTAAGDVAPFRCLRPTADRVATSQARFRGSRPPRAARRVDGSSAAVADAGQAAPARSAAATGQSAVGMSTAGQGHPKPTGSYHTMMPAQSRDLRIVFWYGWESEKGEAASSRTSEVRLGWDPIGDCSPLERIERGHEQSERLLAFLWSD